MKKMEERFNKIMLIEIAYSLLYGIFGLILCLKSEIANTTVGILIGIFFLIAGCMQIYTFIDKTKIKLFKYNIGLGILDIILGIFIMLDPLTLINILNISLGIWILIEGIYRISYFYRFKKVGEESNKILLASALLFIFMGVLIIFNPFRSIVITRTIGIFIILYSILNINNLVLLKRRSKHFLKLLK